MSQAYEHTVESTQEYIPAPYAGAEPQQPVYLKNLLAKMERDGWELVQVHQTGNWLYPERCTFKRPLVVRCDHQTKMGDELCLLCGAKVCAECKRDL